MADVSAHAESTSPRLERVIGTGALAATALNCIVGSGIFGLPGRAPAMLGRAAILAYAVCVVLIGLVGLCFAETGSRVNCAGGLSVRRFLSRSATCRPAPAGAVRKDRLPDAAQS
jgi:amino acid transporter